MSDHGDSDGDDALERAWIGFQEARARLRHDALQDALYDGLYATANAAYIGQWSSLGALSDEYLSGCPLFVGREMPHWYFRYVLSLAQLCGALDPVLVSGVEGPD
jgi:hypothetical protein